MYRSVKNVLYTYTNSRVIRKLQCFIVQKFERKKKKKKKISNKPNTILFHTYHFHALISLPNVSNVYLETFLANYRDTRIDTGHIESKAYRHKFQHLQDVCLHIFQHNNLVCSHECKDPNHRCMSFVVDSRKSTCTSLIGHTLPCYQDASLSMLCCSQCLHRRNPQSPSMCPPSPTSPILQLNQYHHHKMGKQLGFLSLAIHIYMRFQLAIDCVVLLSTMSDEVFNMYF